MMENLKEIIGRATMALVAIAMAWAATWLVIFVVKSSSSDVTYGLPLFLVLALVLYVMALALACFVFASRDPSKARVGRVMTWADKISQGMSYLLAFALEICEFW